MSVATLVRRPGYRDLLIGQAVSGLGDWMGTVAFMALTLEVTGSPAAVGGILALRLLPAALGGPLAARAAVRWDRRRTMLAMDAVRAAMIALVPFVRALWWIYIWAFLIEVASLVFLPARDASIPDVVDGDDLPARERAHPRVVVREHPARARPRSPRSRRCPVADLAGRPFALVFFIDALTFLVSFVFIAHAVDLAGPGVTQAQDEDVGFRRAFRIPLVRAIMPAAAAVALGLGALFSLGIVFVRDVLDASDAEFGWLIALFGVGAVLGVALLQRMHSSDTLCADAQRGRVHRRDRRGVQPRAVAVDRVPRRRCLRRGCRLHARRRDGSPPVAARRVRPSARVRRLPRGHPLRARARPRSAPGSPATSSTRWTGPSSGGSSRHASCSSVPGCW